MKRIFGQKKPEQTEEAPKGPSLEETSGKMDGQITEIDAKIAKCDEDIKSAMQKMRENPRSNAAHKGRAMQAMKRAKPEQIAPHFDNMMKWLDHHDWWLRQSAMIGLTPLASTGEFHKPLLTKVAEVLSKTNRMGDFSPIKGITRQLEQADPRIQHFAKETLGKSYLTYPKEMVEPGGRVEALGGPHQRVAVIARFAMDSAGIQDVR